MKVAKLIAIVFCFFLPELSAQERRNAPLEQPTADFAKLLTDNEAQLEAIQAQLSTMQSRRRTTTRELTAIDSQLFRYAESMRKAFEKAAADAQAAANSQGKSGNTANLLRFETVAPEHQRKVTAIAERRLAVEQAIEDKRIEHTSDLLGPGREYWRDMMYALQGPWSFELIPEAHGAVAAPCVPSCAAKNWTLCGLCVAQGIPAAVDAWNSFRSCWNNAKKPYQAAKRAYCVAVFIGKLA